MNKTPVTVSSCKDIHVSNILANEYNEEWRYDSMVTHSQLNMPLTTQWVLPKPRWLPCEMRADDRDGQTQ